MAKILTVTPNPALDIATSTLHVEPTRKLRCGPAVRHPGGGGINVARVAVRLGAHVRAIYPAGGSAGQELQALVQRDGVQSSVIPTEGATREDLTVLDETTREEFRFVLPGPYLSEPEWRQCLEALASCELRPDFICASGSLPPGAPENFYAQVARSRP